MPKITIRTVDDNNFVTIEENGAHPAFTTLDAFGNYVHFPASEGGAGLPEGEQGQLVGYDEDGNPVAVDPPVAFPPNGEPGQFPTPDGEGGYGWQYPPVEVDEVPDTGPDGAVLERDSTQATKTVWNADVKPASLRADATLFHGAIVAQAVAITTETAGTITLIASTSNSTTSPLNINLASGMTIVQARTVILNTLRSLTTAGFVVGAAAASASDDGLVRAGLAPGVTIDISGNPATIDAVNIRVLDPTAFVAEGLTHEVGSIRQELDGEPEVPGVDAILEASDTPTVQLDDEVEVEVTIDNNLGDGPSTYPIQITVVDVDVSIIAGMLGNALQEQTSDGTLYHVGDHIVLQAFAPGATVSIGGPSVGALGFIDETSATGVVYAPATGLEAIYDRLDTVEQVNNNQEFRLDVLSEVVYGEPEIPGMPALLEADLAYVPQDVESSPITLEITIDGIQQYVTLDDSSGFNDPSAVTIDEVVLFLGYQITNASIMDVSGRIAISAHTTGSASVVGITPGADAARLGFDQATYAVGVDGVQGTGLVYRVTDLEDSVANIRQSLGSIVAFGENTRTFITLNPVTLETSGTIRVQDGAGVRSADVVLTAGMNVFQIYDAFRMAGIMSGGLFSASEDPNTSATILATIWSGTNFSVIDGDPGLISVLGLPEEPIYPVPQYVAIEQLQAQLAEALQRIADLEASM